MTGTTLYRFYDADDRLLYVGITSRGPQRWANHENHQHWWPLVSRTTVEHFPERRAAMTAELAAIRSEKPVHNVAGTYPPRPQTVAIYRRHGQGSIHHQPNGLWAVVLHLPGGRRVARRFAVEDEARLFLAVTQYRHVTLTARRKAIEVLEAGMDWDPPLQR